MSYALLMITSIAFARTSISLASKWGNATADMVYGAAATVLLDNGQHYHTIIDAFGTPERSQCPDKASVPG